METTKLSSKGQIILPVSIRLANQWQAGVEFAVENTADGVLLRPLKPVATTTLDEVIGCTGYTGKAQSIEDMDAAITAEVKSRHARG
jgi:bifunctional DNA-binding transcriptional regulator/antitoxin component of YhaV-PrlF toxin-antitoxin module